MKSIFNLSEENKTLLLIYPLLLLIYVRQLFIDRDLPNSRWHWKQDANRRKRQNGGAYYAGG